MRDFSETYSEITETDSRLVYFQCIFGVFSVYFQAAMDEAEPFANSVDTAVDSGDRAASGGVPRTRPLHFEL